MTMSFSWAGPSSITTNVEAVATKTAKSRRIKTFVMLTGQVSTDAQHCPASPFLFRWPAVDDDGDPIDNYNKGRHPRHPNPLTGSRD